MVTLSYGFLLPTSGDKGASLFSALAQNIQQLNNHTHDGINSPLVSSLQIKGTINTIPASGWASYGGPIGDYRQIVTTAPGYTFDDHTMSFRTVLGEYCYLKVQKITPTTFYVYSNDPTLTLTVNYGG